MKGYQKIQTIFKRNPKTNQVILGDYSLLEFGYLSENEWIFTEKVDGTNVRVMWSGVKVSFGGKTDDAQIPTQLLSRLKELFGGEEKEELFKTIFNKSDAPITVCLYGEGYGAKIGENGQLYKPDGTDFVLFDVNIGGWWLERVNIEDIALKLGIEVVPPVGEGTLLDAVEMTKLGFRSRWGDFLAEGIVAKPKVELKSRKGERIITKIKHKDFLSPAAKRGTQGSRAEARGSYEISS